MPGGDLLIQTVDLIAPIVDDPATFGTHQKPSVLLCKTAMGFILKKFKISFQNYPVRALHLW